jgi:hypothetical protein
MGVSGSGGVGCRSAAAVLKGHPNAEFTEGAENQDWSGLVRPAVPRMVGGGEIEWRGQEGSFKTCRAEQRHYGRLVFIVNRLLVRTVFCWG